MANTPDTAGPEGAAKALAGAKGTLQKAEQYTGSVIKGAGGGDDAFAPPKPPKEVPGISKYHVVRAARDAKEPVGGMSGAEGKAALDQHDAAMKALHPDQ